MEQKYHKVKKMQITTLEGIVEGKLLNLPSISFITQINTKVSKINEGDLFICSNSNDIEQAIKNGAFAILFDDPDINISIDQEIAWIKVDDLEHATVKLVRFLLNMKEIKGYFCDTIVYELIKYTITNKKNIKLLTANIMEDFYVLKNITSDDIIVCKDYDYIFDLHPTVNPFYNDKKYKNIHNLTIHSLFNTSFTYKSYFFDYIRLPYLYINQFISLLEFISTNKLVKTNIDITQLKYIKYLSPIFIDHYYNILDFGKSSRFIVSNDDDTLVESQISFIKTRYDFGKFEIIKDYENDKKLLELIHKSKFNALYIIGKSKDDIENILKSYQKKHLALFS